MCTPQLSPPGNHNFSTAWWYVIHLKRNDNNGSWCDRSCSQDRSYFSLNFGCEQFPSSPPLQCSKKDWIRQSHFITASYPLHHSLLHISQQLMLESWRKMSETNIRIVIDILRLFSLVFLHIRDIIIKK
jgi:hypothetical protein